MTENDSTLERKLVTILSADVAEYSRLMAEDEEQTIRTFRSHRAVVDQLVALHRGRIFNTAGDAFLAEFGSAVEAVRCATEIQSALRTRNEKLPKNREVRFRIGVNLGDVLVQGTDLLGDGVNIAARLQGAAEPGGVCISGSVYDQISSKLSLEMHSLGEKTYKNIPQPVRTFSVGFGNTPARPPRASFPSWVMPGFAAAFALLAMGFYFAHRMERFSAPFTQSGLAVKAAPEFSAAVKPVILPERSAKKFTVAAGTRPARFTIDPSGAHSLSDAIAQAAPGDVIELRPGRYKEKCELNKSVTIRGLPDPEGNLGVRIESAGGEVIRVSQGSVRLENLEIAQLSNAATGRDAALVLEGGTLTLLGVGVWSAGESASNAFSIHGGEAFVSNSNFRGRRGIDQMAGKLHCDLCNTSDNLEEGVVVMNQASDPAMLSDFTGLESSNNGFHGVAVLQGAHVKLKGCRLTANGVSGIETIQTGHATLSHCDSSGNRGNGAVAGDSSWLEITAGESSQNKFSGAAAKDKARLVVKGSVMRRNGEFGYVLMEKATGMNENNQLQANHAGAVYRQPAAK